MSLFHSLYSSFLNAENEKDTTFYLSLILDLYEEALGPDIRPSINKIYMEYKRDPEYIKKYYKLFPVK